MLVIRLRRIGKKSRPTYRVVVAEHTAAVQGSFVADLGFYNPHSKTMGLKKEEIVAWMNKGAQPSNTVAKLLEHEKVKHASVIVTKFKKAPKKAAEPAAPKAAPAEATETETEPNEAGVTDEAATEEVAPAETEETAAEEPAEAVEA